MPFYLEAFQLKINLALVQFSFFFFSRKVHDAASEKNICHNNVSTYVETLSFHFAISGNRVLNSWNQISSKWILNREQD